MRRAGCASARRCRSGGRCWAARHEQPAHFILEGDPDAVDEFDVPGDGEAEELRRLEDPDDEEDEMDTT